MADKEALGAEDTARRTVSPAALLRLSGLAVMLSVPFTLVGLVIHPPSEEVANVLNPLYAPAHLIELVGWALLLLGLPGLYARQAARAGRLGLVSFPLLMLYVAYGIYILVYEGWVTPLLASEPATQGLIGLDGPLAHGAGALGPVGFLLVLAIPLFGIATLRAGVLPRWSAWLQIVSVPAFILGFIVVGLAPPAVKAALPGWDTGIPAGPFSPVALHEYLLFLGYAVGGYAVWKGQARSVERAGRLIAPQPAV
jgi:hypothetical protein